jgi:hypothetical protein
MMLREFNETPYRRQGEFLRFRSSGTLHYLPCRDHQFRSGRQRCATKCQSVLQSSAWRTYANDTLSANQLDKLVGGGALAIALSVGLEVAQVAYMAGLIGRSTVGLAVWVDCFVSQPHSL